MMTSPLSMFSSSFFSYTVVVLTIFNYIQYKSVIVGADDPSLKFDVSSCLVVEPYYNNTFDLLGLKTDLGRVVKLQKEQIRFNFCSSYDRKCGDKQNVHACLEKNEKEYVLATSQKIVYDNGRMTFQFDGGELCQDGKNYQLIVDLGCDYTIDSKLFGFVNSTNSCLYHIKFEHRLACLKFSEDVVPTSACKVTDQSYTFDLSLLGEFNYRVSDRNNSEFILNPCQPVLYDFNATCPSGSSICYYSGKENLSERFLNYGRNNPNPTIKENHIVIVYDSDTKCNATHNYKSEIFFICDWTNEYGSPKYNHVSECTHYFVWQTSFACKKSEKQENIPCVLRDVSTNFVFNMSSLANKNYESTFNGKKYNFAVCKFNDEKKDLGAYLLNGENQESRGRISDTLLRDKTGTPYLRYNSNNRCSESMTWTTEIFFICPESLGSENKIQIQNDSNCTLQINFETKLACQYDGLCKIPDSSIDLTSLINSTGYYVAKINDSVKDTVKATEFLINVCRPVMQTTLNKCYDGSGACIVSLDKKDEQSLGHPIVSLTKTGDSIAELIYFNGSPCPDVKMENLSSSIEFHCDHKAGKGTPILQSVIDKCHYKFDWATNVICPQHSVKFNADTCEIINNVTDTKFGLKDAKFAEGKGEIMMKAVNGTNEVIDLCNHKDLTASIDYSHSIVTMFFKSEKKCTGQDSSNILIQLNLICGSNENRTILSVGSNCSFVINQNAPDICPFLGISATENTKKVLTTITTTNTATTTTTTLKPITESVKTITTVIPKIKGVENSTASPAQESAKSPNSTKPTTIDAGSDSSSGSMSASGIIVTFLFCFALFAGCVLILLRNENIRNKIRGVLTRNSNSGVQYSRVRHEDAANLLLQNVPTDDTDDEMLL